MANGEGSKAVGRGLTTSSASSSSCSTARRASLGSDLKLDSMTSLSTEGVKWVDEGCSPVAVEQVGEPALLRGVIEVEEVGLEAGQFCVNWCEEEVLATDAAARMGDLLVCLGGTTGWNMLLLSWLYSLKLSAVCVSACPLDSNAPGKSQPTYWYWLDSLMSACDKSSLGASLSLSLSTWAFDSACSTETASDPPKSARSR